MAARPLQANARNPQLDGLRALAILLVLVAHVVRTSNVRANAAREIVGEIGVSLFFVLSGFLITTLLIRERERTGRISFRDFYVRRALRIFPAYYVYLAVVAGLAAGGVIAAGPREIAIAALYLRDYDVHSYSWLEHTWSLAVETQFYFLWPAALVWLGNRRALAAAVGLIALEPLVRIGTYFLFPSQRDLMSIALHTRVDTLMFGCAVALAMERGAPLWLQSATRRVSPVACLLVLAACVVAAGFLRGAFQYSIGMTIEGAACTLFLVGVVEKPSSPTARLLQSSPSTWLGRISYSLYLWQQPFLFPVAATMAIARFPVDLILAFAAAAASYYVVERTFFRAKPVKVQA